MSAELRDTIVAATGDLPDAAEVVAVGRRTIIAKAEEDSTLGWLMVRFELSHELVSTVFGPAVLRDLQRGVDEGRFTVPDPQATLIALGGALLGVVRAVLGGRAGEDAGRKHAVVALQLLGLTADEADEVARRPLPASL